LRSRLRVQHSIPHAPDRLDELLPLPGVEFLAQRVDVDVDDVGRKIERVVPYPGLDLRAGDDLSPPPQEKLEESPLPGGQSNALAVAHDLARLGVVRDAADGEGARLLDL